MEFPFVRLSVNAASVGESSGTEKRGGGGVREREKKKGSQRKSELFQCFCFFKSEVIEGQRGAGEPLDSRPLLGIPARIV